MSALVHAPLDRVWAWWTDFGKPGDEFRVSHGLGSSTRRILDAGPGEIVIEDRSIGGTIRRTVRVGPDHRIHETGAGAQRFESEWRFEAVDAARTRVTRTMRLRAAAVFKPFAWAVTLQDLRHHCREATRDLRPR